MKRLWSVALTALLATSLAQAQDKVSDDLTNFLYALKGQMRAGYAPTEWKSKFSGYDLEAEFKKAMSAAQASPNLSLREAQGILRDFVYATRDYHTSIRFYSTESASLPFTVKGAGDRYFIMHIDRSKLPMSVFPFLIGDELVTFDGKDTGKVVTELQALFAENVSSTDKALAELAITSRRAARGYKVPQGAVSIGVRSRGSPTVRNHQLVWDYTPEKIADRGDLRLNNNQFSKVADNSALSFFRPQMSVNVEGPTSATNPYALGSRKTFTPDLGMKIWESQPENTFHAYIYKTADRKLIGYVRIAGYIVPDYVKALNDFAEIISLFQSATDSMVIDQVDNPGGSVYYLYMLASMLSDQPLITPQHRMTINQGDVAQALQMIPVLESIQSDEEAKKQVPPSTLDGYVTSYEFVRFYLNYCRFIIDEWNAGRKLTRPYWIGGIDHINPGQVTYTKPILVLVNQLDFSGGDFFPTILQDNKRVTVLGARTAGAGGYVLETSMNNNLGVETVRYTGSLAARVDGNPIENLGVKPDIEYQMTADDYTMNYGPYVKLVQDTITGMTP